MVRVARSATAGGRHVDGNGSAQATRELLAEFCRALGDRLRRDATETSGNGRGKLPVAGGSGKSPRPADPEAKSAGDSPELPRLSPRLRQTLDGLLDGESEKQIALRLAVSRHTVHVYVKMLYRCFGVSSRGELLSRFVRRPGG
jgi:DNA-binding NarL/FixJ family response regulator